MLLDLSQIRVLSRLDEDVVASVQFVAKTVCIGRLSFAIVLMCHVTKRVAQNRLAIFQDSLLLYALTFSRCPREICS